MLAVVRYVLRLLMLNTRLSKFYFTVLNPVTFAIFGMIENFIGIVRLFDNKKRLIKFQTYNPERIKCAIKKQKQKDQQKFEKL